MYHLHSMFLENLVFPIGFIFYIILECVEIPLDPDFKSESFFQENNITISALTLVEASLLFSIKGIHFKPNGPLNSPDCYAFDLRLVFDNQGEDGQLLVSLVTEARHLDCKGTVDPPVSDGPSKSIRSAVNILVIGTCALSLYLCGRAVLKAQLLKWVRWLNKTFFLNINLIIIFLI